MADSETVNIIIIIRTGDVTMCVQHHLPVHNNITKYYRGLPAIRVQRAFNCRIHYTKRASVLNACAVASSVPFKKIKTFHSKSLL